MKTEKKWLEKNQKAPRVFPAKEDIDFEYLASLGSVARALWLSRLQSKSGVTQETFIKFLGEQDAWKEGRK